MATKYTVIIFDWDGTLIDSIPWIVTCLQKATRQCDLPVPTDQAARDIIGLSLTQALATLFPSISATAKDSLIKTYGQHYFSRQIGKQDLFDGVYAMLGELKSTAYRLAVATGKTRVGLDKVISATATEHLFELTRCADETASKPDPKMITEILDHFNVEHDQVLLVGDSVHDLQMAENAGINAVAVTCGAHNAATLAPYKPLACLSKTTDLLEFLRDPK